MPQTDAGDGEVLRRFYDDRALDEALVAGLHGDELDAVLCGRSPTDVVPPRPGEEPGDYAGRAVGEFLLLYVTRWHGERGGLRKSEAPGRLAEPPRTHPTDPTADEVSP